MSNKTIPERYPSRFSLYAKLPSNVRKVTRQTRWGNPFKLIKHGGIYTLDESLAEYKKWLDSKLIQDPGFLDELYEYEFIACHCPANQRCHVDVIREKMRSMSLSSSLNSLTPPSD